MSFVFCQRHGGHVGPLLCAHLRQAVQERLPLPEVFFVEAWYLGAPAWSHHLCPTCAREIGVTENCTIWKDDDGLDRLMGTHDVAPVCPRCFDEAKRSQGSEPR
jgi:hypothetical protein